MKQQLELPFNILSMLQTKARWSIEAAEDKKAMGLIHEPRNTITLEEETTDEFTIKGRGKVLAIDTLNYMGNDFKVGGYLRLGDTKYEIRAIETSMILTYPPQQDTKISLVVRKLQ